MVRFEPLSVALSLSLRMAASKGSIYNSVVNIAQIQKCRIRLRSGSTVQRVHILELN